MQAVTTGWKRLAILHFPTNGLLTDRVVHAAERLATHSPWLACHERAWRLASQQITSNRSSSRAFLETERNGT
jgi:hypothetical protein